MVRPMKNVLAHSCLIGLLASTVACGDEERNPPPYQSGVTSDAPVAELSDAQKRQICERYGAHVNAYLDINQIARAVCLPTSLLLGGNSAESCEQFLAECTDNFLVTGKLNATINDEAACVSSLDTCETSVVDLEGCVNFNLELVYDILDRLSCRRFNDDEAKEEARKNQQAASVCSQKHTACGAIVEGPIL